jgi:predicted transcriptional regulator
MEGRIMKNLVASDIMTRPVLSARKNASVRDITLQLLSGLYSGMPVTDDEGTIIGIVTEVDILEQIQKGKELGKILAGDIMTRDPIITVSVTTSLDDVIKTMIDEKIVRLPVTDDGKLVGVIARCDLLKAVIEPEFVSYM